MGDDKDPSASTASETAPSAEPIAPSAPVSVVPRPVSLPPRPIGGATPTSRMPPPPSSRGVLPGGVRSSPPPPPQRQPTAAPVSSVTASPSVIPRPAATPPPPPQRLSSSPGFARPSAPQAPYSVTAHLEQRLGATQIELRKLGSERHTLRARLRREADRRRELESALRAEKDLRAQASDEHFGAILGLRARLAEVEAERDGENARLSAELEQARTELEQARTPVPQSPVAPAAPSRASKLPQGLRRIRGIGPAYQRVLEQAGVTRVQQIARWTEAELLLFAEKLKIRPDRITKDDWIGQAKSLDPDPED